MPKSDLQKRRFARTTASINSGGGGILIGGTATNADTVDNLHASSTATAGKLLSLDAALATFPASTITLNSTSGLETTSGLAIADTVAGAGLAIASKVLAVGAGNGISVAADAVAVSAGTGISVDSNVNVDETYGFTWTGAHTFQNTMTTRAIQPELGDAYDIGTSTKLFRKAYISEIDALIFAEDVIHIEGARLIVGHDQGAIVADIDTLAGTIDFGQAMTEDDFLEFRAAGKVEYMQAGTLIADTSYTAVRDLDGSGANEWAAGTPFLVLGTLGDGRIELNAADSPRIQILEQGGTYSVSTERVRIGDLNGAFGITSELYGFGVGDYSGGNYLRYDPTNNFTMSVGNDSVRLGENGIRLEQGDESTNYLSWYEFTGPLFTTEIGRISADLSGDDHVFRIEAAALDATSFLRLTGNSRDDYGYANLAGTLDFVGLSIAETDIVTTPRAMLDVRGDATYTGDLRPYRNSAMGTAYPVVPVSPAATNASWDGDGKNVGTYSIDTSADYGLPAGAKMVNCRIEARWAADDPNNTFAYVTKKGGGTGDTGPIVRAAGADTRNNDNGWVVCDANGDIDVVVVNANTTLTWLVINAYAI